MMNLIRTRQYQGALNAIVAIALASCINSCANIDDGSPSAQQPKQKTEEVARVSQKWVTERQIGTAIGSSTDWSGEVTVTLYVCNWVGPYAYPDSICMVPDTDVAVGGGAEIYSDETPGALLVSSGPYYNDLVGWYVASKDHAWPYPHYLRAYVLGLRLAGVSAQTLHDYTLPMPGYCDEKCGGQASCATPTAWGDNILVGGGTFADYAWAGRLLVRSGPENSDGSLRWEAETSDHIWEDCGYTTPVAIRMSRCPPGFSGCLESWAESLPGPNVSSGYAYSNFAYTSSGVVSSIGANANAPGGGRFLSDLIPYWYDGQVSGAAYASSKDHVADYGYPSAGDVTAQVIRLRKQP